MYCYYAPDRHRQRVGGEMVLMVRFPLCARVSVHFKKAYFAYFVAYIAHFRHSVIGYIYRVKREYLTDSIPTKYNNSYCVVWRIA